MYTFSYNDLLFIQGTGSLVSLSVYREFDWFRLETLNERFDSINTLVMYTATSAISIPVHGHQVLAYLRYPVNSSKS